MEYEELEFFGGPYDGRKLRVATDCNYMTFVAADPLDADEIKAAADCVMGGPLPAISARTKTIIYRRRTYAKPPIVRMELE